MKKIHILKYIVPIILLTSCSSQNLLNYRYKRYHWEFDSYENVNKVVLLSHAICNRSPETVVDGRTCIKIDFSIIDSVAAINKRKLNLISDSNIIKSKYRVVHTPDFSSKYKQSLILGTVKIVSWNKERIVLKERVRFYEEERNDTVNLIGRRAFKRDWFKW